jgi:hypothetical protein
MGGDMRLRTGVLALLCLALASGVALAQQTGAISGKVTDSDGLVLPGVTIEARSNVLPAPRVTVSGRIGDYRLPVLPPGNYTVKFELSGMNTITRQVQVQLAQDTVVDVSLKIQGLSETVTVTAEIVPVIERNSTELKSGISNEQIQSIPVGQEYRDLLKLIPGVQITADAVRGPNAGGSGQDNVYKFDGVNVTLPLFGTLSAEPSTHDIAQLTTVKGGAKAVDFDRSGGFSIDSVSKSGTSRYSGQLSYQLLSAKMSAALRTGSLSKYDQNRTWLVGNVGGPILANRLFFYGSYYRPVRSRQNRANLYGSLPDYSSTRDEGFGKLTFTPINAVLVNVSYRYSHTLAKSDLFASNATSTTGAGNESWQKIATADGSWIIGGHSVLSFKYTNFKNPTQGRPDNVANTTISTDIGTRIDTTNLDRLGSLSVPAPIAGQTAYNDFIQPLVDRYGYVLNGVRTGGGSVGYYFQFDKDDFFRDAAQIAYDVTLGSTVRNDLHFGFQWYTDSEDLLRSSNGWGTITVPGGRSASLGINGIPAYYMVAFQQQSTGKIPTIHSEYRSQNLEFNDTISWKNLSVNLGVLASHDTLYGQGLRNDSSTVSGYVLSAGTQYKMYDVPFKRMIQPRLGATWAYNGKDTMYASFAKYTPAASSLPRAASWARNLAVTINGYFDANGVLYGVANNAASTGKLFVPNLKPRQVDEFLLGTSRQMTPNWSARLYARYRKATHFWEDTNNNARLAFSPPSWVPKAYYIPNLADQLTQIGSGGSANSYVITELDGAFTKYYEVTMESEWRGKRAFVRGSYTWSHYFGNFDQDNTTGAANDMNSFIGSSNLGDGAGRQVWDMKYGNLRGDRRHMLKVYGYYQFFWNGSIGAFGIYQSGQPWEAQSYEPYIALTTSTSDSARNAEPAGSRMTPAHYQIDLNYTQNFRIARRFTFQLAADLFNVFNKQTGYNYQPSVHSSVFGQPRSYYDPRRFQIAARFLF